ncbi:hypothetical protein PTSG_03878 [Salpingoeca rosetta]|uniref:Uncharacterized protein n=1 Tax=Salpingoeca rosetta (strain ATCC 50818 / BSB-021) TaxID=946362 RepID=F2U5N1_SALR5|nr:uncharacterized protein PTSG_03878 [Salpingoeca rosetta]EGD83247.1 hypothetical protein PTSG_03878 [Salpingoeca rosetta]|eukprot:XP_004995611.1 hypothetical protein PTSG_03878 [Salpingoeca rosetta]
MLLAAVATVAALAVLQCQPTEGLSTRTAERVRPVANATTSFSSASGNAWDAGRPPCTDNFLAITADNTYVDIGDNQRASVLGLELDAGVVGGVLIGVGGALEISGPEVLEEPSPCPSLRDVSSRMMTPTSVSVSWETNSVDAFLFLTVNDNVYDITDTSAIAVADSGDEESPPRYQWISEVEYSESQSITLRAVAKDTNNTASWSTVHDPVSRAVQWVQTGANGGPLSWADAGTEHWKPRQPCDSDHTLLRSSGGSYEVTLNSAVVVNSIQFDLSTGIVLDTNGELILELAPPGSTCDDGDPFFTTTTPTTTTPTATTATTTTPASNTTAPALGPSTTGTTTTTTTKGSGADSSTSSSSSTIPIAAGAGGGGLVIIVIIVVLVVRARKRHKLRPALADGKSTANMFTNPAYDGAYAGGMEPNALYAGGGGGDGQHPAHEQNVLYESSSSGYTPASSASTPGQVPNVLYEGSGQQQAAPPLADYEAVPDDDDDDDVYASAGDINQQPLQTRASRLRSNPSYNDTVFTETPLGFGQPDAQA